MRGGRRGRSIVAAVAAVYVAGLALALLAPSSVWQSNMASWVVDSARAGGVPAEWATQQRAEFLCNAAIVAPLAGLAALWWPERTWRDWTGLAFVLACAVELVQGLVLPGRSANYVDIVANTLGACLGAAFVAVLRTAGASARRRAAPGQPPANGGRNSTDDPASMTTEPGSALPTG